MTTISLRISCAFICFFSSIAFAYNPLHLEKFKYTQQCQRCDLNELNLSPEVLGFSDLTGAVLSLSYFYGSSIEHLNLQQLNAREITGLGLLLHDNDLTDADFSYSDLPNLKVTLWNKGTRPLFTGANLEQANFSFSQFDAPQLSQTSLSYAVLYQVKWPGADLSGARLRYANLTYAQLNGANLENANLEGALLNHADLSNANLLNAFVTDEQLDKTASLCNAILPDGSLGECK